MNRRLIQLDVENVLVGPNGADRLTGDEKLVVLWSTEGRALLGTPTVSG